MPGVQRKLTSQKQLSCNDGHTLQFPFPQCMCLHVYSICDSGFVSPCDKPSSFIPVLGGCGGPRSPASAWLVLRPAPAHACNAVCNEKSKQGTAVRHDWNVFPLEGAPRKKKRREKKEEEEETLSQSCVQKECSLGPKRKTNVIVHWLSLCQPSLTNWFLVSLPVSPPPLSLCLPASPRLCLLRWTVTQFWMSPSRPPFCTHGCRLCHRVGVRRGLQRAGSWSSSPLDGREQEVEGQTLGGTKQKWRENAKKWGERVANKGSEDVGEKKKEKQDKEGRARWRKKIRPPILKIRERWL